jgi:hypothetical protein
MHIVEITERVLFYTQCRCFAFGMLFTLVLVGIAYIAVKMEERKK